MSLGRRDEGLLEAVLLAGGSLRIDAGRRDEAMLVRLARAAAKSGATLEIFGAGRRDEKFLVAIAKAGGGRVIFSDSPPADD